MKDELDLGPQGFARVYREELKRNPQRSIQLSYFHGLDAKLRSLGVVEMRLSTIEAHLEAFTFFGCCVSNERMDAGEAESFALAATRGWTFYTDDLPAKRAVDRYNAGDFRCPTYGTAMTLHQPVPVHSTAWLLLKAVATDILLQTEAEAIFLEMQSFWDRHPQQTLAQLQGRGAAAYW